MTTAAAKELTDKDTVLPTLLFLTVASLFLLLIKIYLSPYGLDLTDESYYLVTIADPYEYPNTVTQFGFLLHPIYQLVDGDISSLRSLNVIATLLLSFAVIISTLKYLFGYSISTSSQLLVAFCLAVTSTLVFHIWKTTPNYNSLTYQSILITMIGLLWVYHSHNKAPFFSAAIVGIGGWLAFMAKPTSAMLLALVVVSTLLISRYLRVKWFVQACLISILCLVVSAISIDGSITRFAARLIVGVSIVSTIGHENHGMAELFRIDSFRADLSFIWALLGTSGVILLVGWVVIVKKRVIHDKSFSLILILAGILTLTLITVIDPKLILGTARFPLLLVALPIAATLLISLTVFTKPQFYSFGKISRQHLSLILAFFLMPYVFAFGTGTNYWNKYPLVALFWILGIFVFCIGFESDRKLINRLISFITFCSVMAGAFVFAAGVRHPQREPANLHQNDVSLRVGDGQTKLILNQKVGIYIEEVATSARLAGCCKGTAILDLTGQSPGVVFTLGAKAPGIAWMIGGYPGSQALAEMTLRKVSCSELAVAWLLTEPEGSRSIPTEALSSFGANLEDDYQLVREFVVPADIGGRKQSQKQYLLKPSRAYAVAVSACEQARNSNL